MKKNILILSILFTSILAQAQWLPAGGNFYTTGNIGIGSSTPSSNNTKVNVVTNGTPGIEVKGNTSAAQTPDLAISRSSSTADAARAASIQLSDLASGGHNLVQSSSAGLQFFNWYTGASWWAERMRIAGNGNVAIGTVTPLSRLTIADNGAPLTPTNMPTSGGLSIQGNTGSRSATSGAQLEFVIPANSDGGNLWGQGRIITVAGNNVSGTAVGKMIFGTRRYFDKGTGLGWNYGDDMTIDGNGNIGIGTTSPGVWFGSRTFEFSDGRPVFKLNSTLPTGLATMIFTNNAINTSSHTGEFHINHQLNQIDASKSVLRIDSYPGCDILVLQADGNVGIGTAAPGSFKLAVEGKIGAREINVLTGPWPDYVFEQNYSLPTLAELEAYIKVNKHLPEVPSASVVEENGVNLGEMNMLLLKKVEELTLYVIEQNKVILNQSNDLKQQQTQMEILRAQLITIQKKLSSVN